MNYFSKSWYYIIRSLKIILITLGSLFVLALIIILINFSSWQTIVTNSLSARDNIYSSLYSLLNQDLKGAQAQAIIANENLRESQVAIERIRNTNFFFKLPILRRELNSLEKVNQTGILLSSTFISATNLGQQINDNFGVFSQRQKLSIEDKEKLIALAFELEPEFYAINTNLKLALHNLKGIENSWTILPFKSEVLLLKNQLEDSSSLISKALPILRLLPTLGGWPESSRFLILFQNNDELRPTGGFIGSLATLEISKLGQEIVMETSDVYHYDKPSIEFLDNQPPEPIAKYMGLRNWYLRDANWSPDFFQAASFIEQLFYKESYYAGKEFYDLDAIFAITPQLVANLIELTGPIEIDGQVYNSENLQSLLQYQTGVAYIDEDIASWDRKDVIGDIALVLKKRLENLSTLEIVEVLRIVREAIYHKDLLTYFTNPSNQKIAENLNSDGRIVSVDHDYLMIVDANLAAFKTDAVVVKDWYYQIEKNSDNQLIANLSLNYRHQGGFDWRTTRYQSYTRVLTPKGSQLLSIENARDIDSYYDEELNKTVFGFYFSVEPQQEREIKISYKLPMNIKSQVENNNYQLYLQRQPGSRINSFNFNFLDQALLTKDFKTDRLFRMSN